jgi:hypothetical protein
VIEYLETSGVTAMEYDDPSGVKVSGTVWLCKFLDDYLDSIPYEFDYGQSAMDFSSQCREYIKKAWLRTKDASAKVILHRMDVTDTIDVRDKEFVERFFYAVAAAFRSISDDTGYVEFFRLVVGESRADAIMSAICDVDFKEYFNCWFRLLKGNYLGLINPDLSFVMRMAAVLNMLAKSTESGDMEAVRVYRDGLEDTPDDDQQGFVTNVLNYGDENTVLLSPLTDYLCEVKKHVDDIYENGRREDKDAFNLLRISRESPDEGFKLDWAKKMFGEWYSQLCYWGGKPYGDE